MLSRDLRLIALIGSLKNWYKLSIFLWLLPCTVQSHDHHLNFVRATALGQPVELLDDDWGDNRVTERMLTREYHHALLLELIREVLLEEPLHTRDTLVDPVHQRLFVLRYQILHYSICPWIYLGNEIAAVWPHLNHQGQNVGLSMFSPENVLENLDAHFCLKDVRSVKAVQTIRPHHTPLPRENLVLRFDSI